MTKVAVIQDFQEWFSSVPATSADNFPTPTNLTDSPYSTSIVVIDNNELLEEYNVHFFFLEGDVGLRQSK